VNHSITASARAISVGGTSRPSALAVWVAPGALPTDGARLQDDLAATASLTLGKAREPTLPFLLAVLKGSRLGRRPVARLKLVAGLRLSLALR
jgi:hypothetical protein